MRRGTVSLGAFQALRDWYGPRETARLEAIRLLDECLDDADRAWDGEELVARMELVREVLTPAPTSDPSVSPAAQEDA